MHGPVICAAMTCQIAMTVTGLPILYVSLLAGNTDVEISQLNANQEYYTAQLMSFLVHLMTCIGTAHSVTEVFALTQSVGFKFSVKASGEVAKGSSALPGFIKWSQMRLYECQLVA